MTHNSSAKQYASRLQDALDNADEITCDQAQEQLPLFVELERSGADVESAYALLLRHLDHCSECIELYSGLAEDLAAMIDAEEALPQIRATAPSFFKATRQTEQLTLRVLQGLKRYFELTLQLPSFAPAVPTYKDDRRINLFSDSLPELSGTPLLAVALSVTDDMAELTVAIREAATATRWEIQLIAPSFERTATTNEQGIVRFSQLPLTSLQELTLRCRELGSSSEDT